MESIFLLLHPTFMTACVSYSGLKNSLFRVRAQRPRPWQRPGGSVRSGAEGLGGDERALGGQETRLEPEPEPRQRSSRVLHDEKSGDTSLSFV